MRASCSSRSALCLSRSLSSDSVWSSWLRWKWLRATEKAKFGNWDRFLCTWETHTHRNPTKHKPHTEIRQYTQHTQKSETQKSDTLLWGHTHRENLAHTLISPPNPGIAGGGSCTLVSAGRGSQWAVAYRGDRCRGPDLGEKGDDGIKHTTAPLLQWILHSVSPT